METQIELFNTDGLATARCCRFLCKCPGFVLRVDQLTSSSPPLQHVEDPEPIVADSCIVALDVLEFEQAGEFQYADLGIPAESATAPQVC